MAKRRLRLWLAAAVLLLAAGIIVALLLHPWRQTYTANPPGDALLAASQGLDEIVIHAEFTPVSRTMQVEQTLSLINRTGVSQRLAVPAHLCQRFQQRGIFSRGYGRVLRHLLPQRVFRRQAYVYLPAAANAGWYGGGRKL